VKDCLLPYDTVCGADGVIISAVSPELVTVYLLMLDEKNTVQFDLIAPVV
jgi:hypothetical protein